MINYRRLIPFRNFANNIPELDEILSSGGHSVPGAWAAPSWTRFGNYTYGNNINEYCRELESAFFNYYLKDPQRPVPCTNGVFARNNEYRVEDQRFASQLVDRNPQRFLLQMRMTFKKQLSGCTTINRTHQRSFACDSIIFSLGTNLEGHTILRTAEPGIPFVNMLC